MKFDLKGRTGPAKVIRYRNGREYAFDMPHETEDPVEIEILGKDPLVFAVDGPTGHAFDFGGDEETMAASAEWFKSKGIPAAEEAAPPDSKPPKTSRKEV